MIQTAYIIIATFPTGTKIEGTKFYKSRKVAQNWIDKNRADYCTREVKQVTVNYTPIN